MSTDPAFLARLEARLNQARAVRQRLIDGVKRERRDQLTDIESRELRDLCNTVDKLEERCTEIRGEIERSGRGPGGYLETTALGRGGGDAESMGRRLAHDVATELHRMTGERRVVISGSVDVPILVDLPVPLFETPFPQRIIDVLPNRISIDSMAFEFYRQTAHVNNAAPVSD